MGRAGGFCLCLGNIFQVTCLRLSISLPVYVSVCLSVCLLVCYPSASLSLSPFLVLPSICLSVPELFHPSVCLYQKFILYIIRPCIYIYTRPYDVKDVPLVEFMYFVFIYRRAR